MDSIDEIISKKPHLTDPLRFYEKAMKFTDAIAELRIPSRPDLNAYPPEFADQILQCFSALFELPEGSLSPLKQALELGEIDFRRLPLLEVPAFSLPYPEDDLTLLLFLISRPYFLGMRDRGPANGRRWEEGRCPVCSARPSLTSPTHEDRRQLHCSFCGTVGYDDTMGCPLCLTVDAAKQNIFSFDGEDGFTVHTCGGCRSYVKTVDEQVLARMTPDIADLLSLPLDIVIQEKGFKRSSPNPIGMVRMSARG
jgi:FdhE protein